MDDMWCMFDAVASSKDTGSSHDRPDIYAYEHVTCLLHAGPDD